LTFARYEPVPKQLADSIIEKIKGTTNKS